MVVQLKLLFVAVRISLSLEVLSSATTDISPQSIYKVNYCHSLLQTQQKRSKRYDVADPSQGTTTSKHVKSKDGLPNEHAVVKSNSETLPKTSEASDRNFTHIWSCILQKVALQLNSSSLESLWKHVKLDQAVSSITKALSSQGTRTGRSIIFAILVIILALIMVVWVFGHTELHEEDNYDMSEPSSQTAGEKKQLKYKSNAQCLCPELVPHETTDGSERVYALQNPGVQVPGEMVLNNANGDLVVRTRTGAAGGALLILVAPGGAVLASCQELKVQEGSTSVRHHKLLVKDRLGSVFAQIYDKGHIEAHIHNGKRLTVIRQQQTGAMTVVNEQSRLLATLEPPREHNTELSLLLRAVTGVDLGMILLALLAHSCFERRNPLPSYASQVHAPPLLRMASQKAEHK